MAFFGRKKPRQTPELAAAEAAYADLILLSERLPKALQATCITRVERFRSDIDAAAKASGAANRLLQIESELRILIQNYKRQIT